MSQEKYIAFTEDEIVRAGNVDLHDFLTRHGETLKRDGREYRWVKQDGSDSTTINGYRWFDHKNQIGGNAIQFIKMYMNLGFKDAVLYLLNGRVGEVFYSKTTFRQSENIPEKPKTLKLPKWGKNMKRLFGYLVSGRKIDADVVKFFVKSKMLYEDDNHNCVFVGSNKAGEVKYAHKKGTNSESKYMRDVLGSSKKYGFCHRGSNCKLFVVEAPVDLLSFITISKNKAPTKDWKQNNYISLGGIPAGALLTFLGENQNINEVFLCLDNDKAGLDATKRINERLILEGFDGKVKTMLPSECDWNDDLVTMKRRSLEKREAEVCMNENLMVL